MFSFVRSCVCLFVCLFVKCAYAREETHASSSFAGTCMPSNSTKRHKKREKQQNTRASSSFAGTCIPSKSTKRHKKGEKQQNTRASSSFAGYSTSFRGTFSRFLARKTLKNDFTHWNIVQMKIFQGLYSRISRSERWVFFFWLKFDFFPLQGAFFVHFSPTFRFPKNNFFPSLHYFYPTRNTSMLFTKYHPKEEQSTTKGGASTTHAPKESYAQIRRKQHVKREEATRKTRKNNAQNTKKTSEIIQKISNVFRKKSNVFQEISHVFEKSPTFFIGYFVVALFT